LQFVLREKNCILVFFFAVEQCQVTHACSPVVPIFILKIFPVLSSFSFATHLRAHPHPHNNAQSHTHTHIFTHTYEHTHTHTLTQTHTHTHIYIGIDANARSTFLHNIIIQRLINIEDV